MNPVPWLQMTNMISYQGLVRTFPSPITFSINAPWGTGKTTFINMLKADLELAQCSTVLFSAWHTDFAGDPLLAFLGEIDSQLHKGSVEHNPAWSLTKSAGEILIKKGIPAALKIMTMGVLGRVRISTLHNETEKISLLNSNTYKGAFLCLVTYSHLP